MSIQKKLDQATSSALRSILSSLNITNNRIIIDLNNDTVEVEEEHNIDDLLRWAGTMSKEQAKELQDRINRNKEEDWD